MPKTHLDAEIDVEIDDFTRRVQAWGCKEQPKAFVLAKRVCESYERRTEPMTKTQQFDFRRAFELGYYFATLKHHE